LRIHLHGHGTANISADIEEVLHAIAMLESGQYGVCEYCEAPIGARRLDVTPLTRVCVKCQRHRDARAADADENITIAA
jgi:RNA polymerase-binding transcription factor DksA